MRVQASGPSMLPTIEERNFVLVDYFSYKILRKPFKKGDVVFALAPGFFFRPVCKRICGVPGDEIHYENPYTKQQECLIIPDNHVWLLGDNSSLSGDSRHYGPVPKSNLRGRIVCKLWPYGMII